MRTHQMHLYLLIGQSNMAGAGHILPEDKLPVDGIFTLNSDDEWEPAKHPLQADRGDENGFCLGLDFAKTIRSLIGGGHPIGLIPCAVGGTPLLRWQKDGDLYENALRRAKIAMNNGTVKAILWHQGENDALRQNDADTYLDRLSQMIADIRGDLGDDSLPFIVGELGRFLIEARPQTVQSHRTIQTALRNIPQHVPNTACVSSEGLAHKGDSVHFNRDALIEFGRRYADALADLLKRREGES